MSMAQMYSGECWRRKGGCGYWGGAGGLGGAGRDKEVKDTVVAVVE